MPQVNVRVNLGFAVLVTTGGSTGQPVPQSLGLKLPKFGALRVSPGLTVSVITPPLTLQVSAGFTLAPVNVHAPLGGAVCVQPGPCVPSVRVTVWVPSLLLKLVTANEMHPLSSVCAFTVPPLTPVAVIGQCGSKGSPLS